MQIVWEESGCLLLSHQDTLFQKPTGQIDVSQAYAGTLTVMLIRDAHFKPDPLWHRLVDGDIWAEATFIQP